MSPLAVGDLWRVLRPAPVAPEMRRLLRWWSARWAVRLAGTAVGLVLLTNAVLSWGAPHREPVRASAPSLARLDAALTGAESYLDGLYRELPDGRSVVSEHYGLPLVVHFAAVDDWVRPGDRELTITAGEVTLLKESALFRYEALPGAAPVQLVATVRWAEDRAYIGVAQVGGPLTEMVVRLGDQVIGRWEEGAARRSVSAVTDAADLGGWLRSLRYTVRHVAMLSESTYAYRGVDERSERLAATVADAGYDSDTDVYAPAWGRSLEQPDDFAFAASVYRDCTDPAVVAEMPDAPTYYPYQSKVCTVPTPGYVAMTREDPLVSLSTALHVLEKYDDAEREYSDGEHLNITPQEVAGQMEQRFRADRGIAECLLGVCGSAATSTLRTALFGMLETRLGFGAGDEIARGYADAVAAWVLSRQVGPAGVVPTTTYGDLVRPQEVGGFYTHVSRDGLAGEPPSFVGDQMSRVASALDIRAEHVGDISTNAETTLVAYAFLVRYRCARYDVGCAGLSPPETSRTRRSQVPPVQSPGP